MIDYDCGNHNEPVGALAFLNKGNIDNCYVKDLFIKSRATVYDGDTTKQINNVGTGVVAESDDPSNIRCNYVENLKLKGSDMDGDHVTAIANIVTMASRRHNEMYENNYFKQIYRSKYAEEYGVSIYSLTEDPLDEQKATAEAETPEFIRYLAGTMNAYLEDKAWGTSGKDKSDLFLTALDGGIYKAPVQAVFKANGIPTSDYVQLEKFNLRKATFFHEKRGCTDIFVCTVQRYGDRNTYKDIGACFGQTANVCENPFV
jgi:hypothetical protein